MGFVAGYWTRKDGTSLSMLVFESEEAATNAEQRLRANMPERVDLGSTRFAPRPVQPMPRMRRAYATKPGCWSWPRPRWLCDAEVDD
jgi:hypothetical protein